MVPLAGIEPALLAELDFESSASTNSATGARTGAPGASGGTIGSAPPGQHRRGVSAEREFAAQKTCAAASPRDIWRAHDQWVRLSAATRRGEVAEWSIAPHSKCGVPARVPGVQIPPSPPPYAFGFGWLAKEFQWRRVISRSGEAAQGDPRANVVCLFSSIEQRRYLRRFDQQFKAAFILASVGSRSLNEGIFTGHTEILCRRSNGTTCQRA